MVDHILVEDRCRIGVDIKQHVVRAEVIYELVAEGTFHVLIPPGSPHFCEQVSLDEYPSGRVDTRPMDLSALRRNRRQRR